jgi:hypothetical protein
MKLNARNVKLAWKYRRALWKYRSVIRHRREIGAVAMAGAAIAAALMLKRTPTPETEPRL